jgi:hypothetical protein
MKKSRSKRAESLSELIHARSEDLGDWRGEMLSRLRALIKGQTPRWSRAMSGAPSTSTRATS